MVRIRRGSLAWYVQGFWQWVEHRGMVSLTVLLTTYFAVLIRLGL